VHAVQFFQSKLQSYRIACPVSALQFGGDPSNVLSFLYFFIDWISCKQKRNNAYPNLEIPKPFGILSPIQPCHPQNGEAKVLFPIVIHAYAVIPLSFPSVTVSRSQNTFSKHFLGIKDKLSFERAFYIKDLHEQMVRFKKAALLLHLPIIPWTWNRTPSIAPSCRAYPCTREILHSLGAAVTGTWASMES
jgi:hypothetical protein